MAMRPSFSRCPGKRSPGTCGPVPNPRFWVPHTGTRPLGGRAIRQYSTWAEYRRTTPATENSKSALMAIYHLLGNERYSWTPWTRVRAPAPHPARRGPHRPRPAGGMAPPPDRRCDHGARRVGSPCGQGFPKHGRDRPARSGRGGGWPLPATARERPGQGHAVIRTDSARLSGRSRQPWGHRFTRLSAAGTRTTRVRSHTSHEAPGLPAPSI